MGIQRTPEASGDNLFQTKDNAQAQAQNDATSKAGLEANAHPLEGAKKVETKAEAKQLDYVAKIEEANKASTQGLLESMARIRELQIRLTRNPDEHLEVGNNLLKAMGPKSEEFQLKDPNAQRAAELYKVLTQFS